MIFINKTISLIMNSAAFSADFELRTEKMEGEERKVAQCGCFTPGLMALCYGKMEEQVEYKKQTRNDKILSKFQQSSRLFYNSKYYYRSKLPTETLFQQQP